MKSTIKQMMAGTLALGWSLAGCDTGEQADVPSTGKDPAVSTPAEGQPRLTILTAGPSRVTGTLAKGAQGIAFELVQNGGIHQATYTGSSGKLLLRASLSDEREKVEMGVLATVQGPRGSLFGGMDPNWETLTVSGDTSSIATILTDPDFPLIQLLPSALAGRGDVDTSLLPVLTLAPPTAPSPGASVEDPSLVATHDPGGCALCHVICSSAVLACIGATWGPWAPFICVPPGVACHIGCAASACQ